MAITYLHPKLIGKKRFSNKIYSINVYLYEQNMARVEVDCKKRFRTRKWCGGYIPFDHCLTEAIYDYLECIERMDVDKMALRWLKKVMIEHSLYPYLLPNGRIDWEKVKVEEDKLFRKSQLELKLNINQLHILKKYMPELFIAGNYRTDYMKHHNVKSIQGEEQSTLKKMMMKTKGGRKRYERKMQEAHFYFPQAILLDVIKALSESFYKQIEIERTLDDCSISMDYTWYHGEKPELSIAVRDNTYVSYLLP